MTVMSFGRHRGQRVADVPSDYLAWCLNECQCLKSGLRRAINDELEQRRAGRPETNGKLVDWPAVIRRWFHELTLVYHPDRGGSHEAMVAITDAKERLEKMVGA
jgi:hypothetical protein